MDYLGAAAVAEDDRHYLGYSNEPLTSPFVPNTIPVNAKSIRVDPYYAEVMREIIGDMGGSILSEERIRVEDPQTAATPASPGRPAVEFTFTPKQANC